MNFQQLESLRAIYLYKNFSRAANALFVSQSTISKNISSLEDELGLSLLERDKHKVIPTRAGIYLAEKSQELLDELTAVVDETKMIARGCIGTVKIGVSDELDLNALIPGFINTFSQKYPDVKISFCIHNYPALMPLVPSGDIDVAFAPLRPIGGPAIEDIGHITINRATPRLYYSCDNVNAVKDNPQPQDFLNDCYISLGTRYNGTITKLKGIGLEFKNTMYVDSLQAMRLCIEANLGISVLGESYSIINSDKVRNIKVTGIGLVGTDMFFKKEITNESASLFVTEMKLFLKTLKKSEKD